MAVQGGQLAGASQGYRMAGSGANIDMQGGQLAASHVLDRTSYPARGVKYNSQGAQYGSPTYGRWGGSYGSTSQSVNSLIDSDGFVLVLERADGERLAYTPDSPKQTIQSLSITEEVNTKSDWRATVPPNPDLYEWAFSRAVIGYKGNRLFHGVTLPVESSFRESMTIGGQGPLWYATHGNLEVTYPDDHPDFTIEEDIPVWRALNDLWQRVGTITDGKVRGYSVEPADHNETLIPASGESFEGTPLEVLQRLHGYGGMAFSIDHSTPESIGISFIPGEEGRAGRWQARDYSVNLNPADYVNRVVVKGADAPDSYTYDKYRGVAEATTQEIEEVANGRIIEHQMRVSDLSSEAACEAQARSKLQELRGNYTITGSVKVVPTNLTPGYRYQVDEFNQAAPDVFQPVELPLQSIEHSYAVDEAVTTLKFETTEGVVEQIRDRFLPEGASLDVIRQNSAYSSH